MVQWYPWFIILPSLRITAVQPGQLLNNEFMLQKLLSQEETGEVWRALEFNAGYVVQLHFLPRTNLSASKIKKRLQFQFKQWQTSQKPGLVLPVRWNEIPEGHIFLVSPHIEGILPEHYAAQWILESFITHHTAPGAEQDVYLLAEKIVPSEILRLEKKEESEPLPHEEPDSYKYILAAARSASAQELMNKLYKERRFQRAFFIWNICIFLGILIAVILFRGHIARLWHQHLSFSTITESQIESGENEWGCRAGSRHEATDG